MPLEATSMEAGWKVEPIAGTGNSVLVFTLDRGAPVPSAEENPFLLSVNDVEQIVTSVTTLGSNNPPNVKAVETRETEMHWLRLHSEEYRGEWVVLNGFRLVAHGNDFARVLEAAREAGISTPFIVKIPDERFPYNFMGL